MTTDCQPTGIPTVDKMDTQVRLGKDRLGKDKDNMSDKPDDILLFLFQKSIKSKCDRIVL